MKDMKHSLLGTIALSLMIGLSAEAMEREVASPDGRLRVILSDHDSVPTYQIIYERKVFVKPSTLGVQLDFADYTKGVSLMDELVEEKDTLVDYALATIKKSRVHHQARQAVFPFQQHGKRVFDLLLHVSDHDVALCYRLYPIGETLCATVPREATSFHLPQGTTTFLCPASAPMSGWKRTYPSYETDYTTDDEMGKNGLGYGYTFPCLFRIGDGEGWLLLSETGVDGSYCAGRLLSDGADSYRIGQPHPAEMNGAGTASPAISLPGCTPWRTITLGHTLAPIVETTIPFDVVKPKYKPSRAYHYGCGTWSWIISMGADITYEGQRKYIDFSAAMGYQSVLVDADWDRTIGRDSIASLSRYGAQKGVGLFLWYNSNGAWNDATGSPYHCMDKASARRKEMAWMRRIGIKGIKVDFFGGDKQPMMQLYEDILTDANDFGLMVIFHGCTLPRGWERMYPNYVASEAVLASENLHFKQAYCDAEARNATLHPFIRNTVGSMDFGGSTLNKYYNADNAHGSRRVTSDVFALATSVLFQSPVQHFSLAPNNLDDAPRWAIDFMKKVPSTWDEVRYLDGYPGKYVVMARRKGAQWFVAGINAEPGLLKLQLELPMFDEGEQLTVYSDDEHLNGSVRGVTIGKKKRLQVAIPCNGAVLVTNNRPGRWSAEEACGWHAAQPWLVGCNYIPSTAINQIEMWSADTFDSKQIDKELTWAEELGFNTLRVYLSSMVWYHDAAGMKQRMHVFLDICERHSIRPLFVLFDDCWNADSSYGPQPQPKAGVHNSGWVQDPTHAWRRDASKANVWLEQYVKDILQSFGRDNRILLWDLYNEVGNNGNNMASMPLLINAFRWAREAAPQQPLSVCVYTFEESKKEALNEYALSHSDIVTYHNYSDAAHHAQCIAQLERCGRPLLCTEYMARRNNSLFSNIMPMLKKRKIGAINWGFVAGKTNTIYAWDEPIPSGEEPKRWFHDILRATGEPYDPKEVELIRDMTGKLTGDK